MEKGWIEKSKIWSKNFYKNDLYRQNESMQAVHGKSGDTMIEASDWVQKLWKGELLNWKTSARDVNCQLNPIRTLKML